MQAEVLGFYTPLGVTWFGTFVSLGAIRAEASFYTPLGVTWFGTLPVWLGL